MLCKQPWAACHHVSLLILYMFPAVVQNQCHFLLLLLRHLPCNLVHMKSHWAACFHAKCSWAAFLLLPKSPRAACMRNHMKSHWAACLHANCSWAACCCCRKAQGLHVCKIKSLRAACLTWNKQYGLQISQLLEYLQNYLQCAVF